MPEKTLIKSLYDTPAGELTIIHANDTVFICEFSDKAERISRQLTRYHADDEVAAGPLSKVLQDSFDCYFAGDAKALDTVTASAAGTPFQKRVWEYLRSIPVGKTISYGEMAKDLGSAPRAVGQANGRNPVALIQPCHRVIGASGKLTGYAGGLARKDWLLKHEAG